MPYTIVSPNKEVETGFVSKWVAANNPVIFELQRRDIEVLTAIKATSTTLKVFVSIPLNVSEVPTAGQFIYLNTGVWVGKFTVVSATVNYIIVSTSKHGSASTTGFLNLLSSRTNFRFECKVNHVVANLITPVNPISFSPNSEGLAKVNISEVLKSFISIQNDFDYQDTNIADRSGSGIYYVQFREVYTGNLDSEFSSINQNVEYYFVNAAQQIGAVNGANLAAYVPTFASIADENRAKFLTVFEQPVYWQEYPFSLSFIYSRDLIPSILQVGVDKQLSANEERFDLNSSTLSTEQTVLDNYQKKFVNNVKLNGSYPASVDSVDFWLEINDVEQTEKAVKGGYVTDTYFEKSTEKPYFEAT